MARSRSSKALINTSCELLLEVVTAICSFILPRLILSYFGSSYNGITSSITQFIGCVALLKSGIGSVTRAALYKPLADNNPRAISEVVNATAGFMKKVAVVFCVMVLLFASLYPFLVKSDFDWIFSFTLVLILSINTFAQYFFGFTYQMVLQADQKNYIISIVTIISTIINTLVAAFLIKIGFGIHIVKLGSAIVFAIPPIFYNIWVKKKYKIDAAVEPNYNLISQRWDAFGHQLANFINTNTDIIVATVFLGVKEVSVYSVYYMVGNALKKAVTAIGSGTTAAFGNMMAREERENIKIRFTQFELLIFYISTILLVTAAILITPFISVYTKGITDVNYIRNSFGILICVSVYFACVKIPYEQIVFAAGEFKRTRNGAFAEAIINISLSVILVNFIGLNGIIVGTIVAISYRTLRYHIFICNNIIARNKLVIVFNLLFTVLSAGGSWCICSLLPLNSINSYLAWILWAIVVFVIVASISTSLGFLMFRKRMVAMFKIILHSMKRLLRKIH